MVEAQKYRIEQEMSNLVNELDKSYLRKMQPIESCLGFSGHNLCECGAIQSMAHLLSCPNCPTSCTIKDLNEANDKGDMHRCAARCCDDQQSSLERVHGCIENCTTPLNQANNYVQGEISHLQNRLQRCVMDCNDSARDRLGADPSQETIDKCTIDFEKCAVKCVDKHMTLIPSMMKTMKKVLASGKPPPPKNE